ncbi:hypothetical protein BYT27DRAFT_7230660 [Phlegmacium glaucopus]|nr:hypothetical protein BYT27DRAFT_7230660 [Phlegmacium glaucopus]
MHSKLKEALGRIYNAVKAQYPTEGRRKWLLRGLYDSWSTITSLPEIIEDGNGLSFDDPDPFDHLTEDDQLGLIIRTDFSNEEAWSAFCNQVQLSQKDLISDLADGTPEQEPEGNDTQMAADDADDGQSDSSNESPDFLKILNPVEQSDRIRFTNMSNITALRFFNDVDIRPTPPRPAGTKPISPPNPLIDLTGWQEIYSGKNIWIYDALSNVDGSVRVVSQTSDLYGTATGDSWRARASHICELQFNMSYQGLKIDFNGLDKWDINERTRNLAESVVL